MESSDLGRSGRDSEPVLVELSLIGLANVVLRHWRVIASTTVFLAFAAVASGLLTSKTYTSEASFSPQSSSISQLGQFSGLAAQFGLEIPTGDASQSPEFYADLLRSNAILSKIVRAQFHAGKENGNAAATDLVGLFGIEEDDSLAATALAVEEMREKLNVSVRRETGVVGLEIATKWPAISRAIAETILDEINQFNLQRRQSEARKTRQFLDTRIEESRQELLAAEKQLETFVMNNRQYSQSPRLQFEYNRLQRRVDLQQQVYMSLLQSYEQARLDEVRDTPVVTIVEPAQMPAKADRRWIVVRGVVGLVIGGLAGLGIALGMSLFGELEQARKDEFDEFHRLRKEMKTDLKGIWGRFRDLFA